MNQIRYKESSRSKNLVDQFEDGDVAIYGRLNAERKFNKVTPLYQRVLSALIIEDETEELEENGGQRNTSIQYPRDDSSAGVCFNADIDPQRRDKMEFEYDSVLDLRTQKIYSPEKISCNGSTTFNTGHQPCSILHAMMTTFMEFIVLSVLMLGLSLIFFMTAWMCLKLLSQMALSFLPLSFHMRRCHWKTNCCWSCIVLA